MFPSIYTGKTTNNTSITPSLPDIRRAKNPAYTPLPLSQDRFQKSTESTQLPLIQTSNYQQNLQKYFTSIYSDKGILEFKQGETGDCFFLSPVYTLTQSVKGRTLLSTMIQEESPGTYKVKFPGNRRIIEVSDEDIKPIQDKLAKGDIGVNILEVAYGKLKGQDTDPLSTLNQGAQRGTHVFDALLDSKNYKTSYEEVFAGCWSDDLNTTDFLTQLANAQENKMITLSSSPYFFKETDKFIIEHEYAVQKIDVPNQKVILVNPHNTNEPLEVTFDEINDFFDSARVAELKNTEKIRFAGKI